MRLLVVGWDGATFNPLEEIERLLTNFAWVITGM